MTCELNFNNRNCNQEDVVEQHCCHFLSRFFSRIHEVRGAPGSAFGHQEAVFIDGAGFGHRARESEDAPFLPPPVVR